MNVANSSLPRKLRLTTGLILFTYVVTHLANHTLGLISLSAMEAGRIWMLAVWRTWPGTVLLYGAILIHIGLAMRRLYRRRNLRMQKWEATQLVFGLAIPPLLIEHVLGTRMLHEYFAVEDLYFYVVGVLWELAPEKGLVQMTTRVVAWIHGCMGLHFWLRLKPGYRSFMPVAYAAVVLFPVLALLGFIEGGREAAEIAQDPVQRDKIIAVVNWPQAEASAAVRMGKSAFWIGFGALLTTILAARLLRAWILRLRGRVQVTYPGGKKVDVPPGYSVLEMSRLAGIPHASVCGGRGRCSTCRVRVGRGAEHLPPPSDDEARVLRRVGAAPDVRLACQVRPSKALEVTPLLPATTGPAGAYHQPGYLHGQEQEIAILFADIRAFTRLSEQKLPYDVVFLLNRYFAAMGRAVEQSGGHLDKFIGDGVMALFGIESTPEDGCRQALDAARAMAASLRGLNDSLIHDLPEPLRIGIGIHVGSAIIGEMGYGRANSLTAVGDAVNTASRLETLTKQFSAQLIVSQDVADRAGRDLSAFAGESVEIRGRAERLPVRVVPDAAALADAPVHAKAN